MDKYDRAIRYLIAFVSGIGLGLMLCGIGHAETWKPTGSPSMDTFNYIGCLEDGGTAVLHTNKRWWVCTFPLGVTTEELSIQQLQDHEKAAQICVVKMETAMQSMKPYTENPLFRPDLHHMPTPEFIAYMEAWRTAAGLWDAVERDCWKKTP